MNRSLLLLVLMPLCALADNPLETQDATETDSKHARDTSDTLGDFVKIQMNKSTFKKSIHYYGQDFRK